MTSRIFLAAISASALTASAPAAFHIMQIEQVIGGINGNTSAQAIQLRMRSAGQNIVSQTRLRAWDSAGQNPVLLLNITDDVDNSNGGARILLTTPAFDSLMSSVPGYSTDFTLTTAIPEFYLTGGKITFEDDFGTIFWSLAFGNYTGTNTGDFTNDPNGNFGPPAPALPTNSRQGIRFTGAASAASNTNALDYALTANPASLTNNNGNIFVAIPEPASAALFAAGVMGLGSLLFARRRSSRP